MKTLYVAKKEKIYFGDEQPSFVFDEKFIGTIDNFVVLIPSVITDEEFEDVRVMEYIEEHTEEVYNNFNEVVEAAMQKDITALTAILNGLCDETIKVGQVVQTK